MQKLKQIIFAGTLGLMVFNPTLVLAATGTNTNSTATAGGINVPEYKGVDSSIADYLCTPSATADGHDLERCVNKLYRFGIAFGAIAVVFFVVFAGYLYITGGSSGKQKGKIYFQNALIGMAILLSSYVLLRFINPNLVVIKPIQPPIFSAANLPSCDAVGLGEKCVVASTGGISTGGGGKCDIPIDASVQNGTYNSTIHGETGSGHGPVRTAPNGAPPLGTVDVGAKGGSPVRSAISGKVVKYGDLGEFGKYVSIISDPQGGEFGCEKSDACVNEAHIEPTVKVGDMVTAGQQIGVTTTWTGGMGPHLHIELKLNGQWILGDGRKGTWDNMKAACSSTTASAAPNNDLPKFSASSAPADGNSVAGNIGAPDAGTISCTLTENQDSRPVLLKFLLPAANADTRTCAKEYYTHIANSWQYHYWQDDYSSLQYGMCPASLGGTVAQSGCGVVATAMVLNWLKGTGAGHVSSQAQTYLSKNPQLFTVESLALQFNSAGFRVCGDGSKWDSPRQVIPFYFDNYSVAYKQYAAGGGNLSYLSKSQSQIDEIVRDTNSTLNQNNAVAIAIVGGKAPWTMKGHFVLVFQSISQGGQQYFKIADPYQKTDVVLIEKELFATLVKGINYISPR
ncbi:MAG TPA: peptidoglycan DD-metalloendopeptidase family protein [Patescibacteria group bacterium]|jgi:biotin carboxyl carrier protein|nr:peptidoglycan DD-metalloendopeptidase family protein [Patescibacteria group bacterium]